MLSLSNEKLSQEGMFHMHVGYVALESFFLFVKFHKSPPKKFLFFSIL